MMCLFYMMPGSTVRDKPNHSSISTILLLLEPRSEHPFNRKPPMDQEMNKKAVIIEAHCSVVKKWGSVILDG